jgi:hypothetical protein
LRMTNVATDEEVWALKRAVSGWCTVVLYAVRAGWLELRVVALKGAVCAQPSARTLGQQRAGFSGQQVGSWPSFSALGCWRTAAEAYVALRRFLPVGKARAGSALAGQVVGLLAGRRLLDT